MSTILQVWVCSPHNASGYYGLRDEINDALSLEHFRATLNGSGDKYARTGYLGFMMKSEKKARNGGACACERERECACLRERENVCFRERGSVRASVCEGG